MAKNRIYLDGDDLRGIIRECVIKILDEGKNSCGVLDKVWISYGADEYDYSKTRDIDIDSPDMLWMNKPHGGLWASPLESQWGWKDFCARDGYGVDSLSKHFLFKLRSDALIYVINDVDDLEFIVKSRVEYYKREPQYSLDFKKLIECGYDGIYVTDNAVWSMRYNRVYPGCDLQCWDVESICIWNDSVVVPLSENEFRKALIRKDATELRQRGYNDMVNDDEQEYYKWNGRKEDIENELENYRNLNVYGDSSGLFKGMHPGVLAQGDDEDDDTEAAKGYRGTKISGMRSLGRIN